MDNDDLRRGRPTVHKAFDEATAILAGDALLTLAFDLMARNEVHPDASVRVALVSELARAAGLGGMAGGQMLDLAAEGRFADQARLAKTISSPLQAMKTGALLRFACRAGAILGQADAKACRGHRSLRRGHRTGVPDRRRPARCRRRRRNHRQSRRQGCRRRQGDAGSSARVEGARAKLDGIDRGRRGRACAFGAKPISCARLRASLPSGGPDPRKRRMARLKRQSRAGRRGSSPHRPRAAQAFCCRGDRRRRRARVDAGWSGWRRSVDRLGHRRRVLSDRGVTAHGDMRRRRLSSPPRRRGGRRRVSRILILTAIAAMTSLGAIVANSACQCSAPATRSIGSLWPSSLSCCHGRSCTRSSRPLRA